MTVFVCVCVWGGGGGGGVWEQTSRDRACGSLTCGSRHHVMGLWVTDVWEQTSCDGAVGH